MSDFRVASRYARSVFELAIELKIVDKIYDDMVLMNQVYSSNRNLVTLLKNPIVRYDYKLRVLNRVFDGHLNELTMKFLALMCRKNRAQIILETNRVFMDLYRGYKGIVQANVSSAVALSANLKKEFEGKISKATGKKVDLDTKVDASLLGGYVLQIGDRQLDDSLKGKLNNLRRELKSRP